MLSGKPAVFVDRDGVIVRNRADYVKSVTEVELLPHAIDALCLLTEEGHRVFVITNQSGVGRGIVSEQEVDLIHDHLATKVAERGGRIESFLVCPHRPDDGCACRKPEPGLLYRARDEFGVDLSAAYLVGDFKTDVEAAATAGCSSILVLSGRTHPGASTGDADHVVEDLLEAAHVIVREVSSRYRKGESAG